MIGVFNLKLGTVTLILNDGVIIVIYDSRKVSSNPGFMSSSRAAPSLPIGLRMWSSECDCSLGCCLPTLNHLIFRHGNDGLTFTYKEASRRGSKRCRGPLPRPLDSSR